MRCAHCDIQMYPVSTTVGLHHRRDKNSYPFGSLSYCAVIFECPNCTEIMIKIRKEYDGSDDSFLVYPKSCNYPTAPKTVPAEIAKDYNEACLVLRDSPKASAALSRRCLQMILRDQGYDKSDLRLEIEALLSEEDKNKSIPLHLQQTIDMIRHFGNFSTHPITDKTSLQVIEVEPEEAETCLEILQALFEHYYVKPSEIADKRAKLDAKLKTAGKPKLK